MAHMIIMTDMGWNGGPHFQRKQTDGEGFRLLAAILMFSHVVLWFYSILVGGIRILVQYIG